MLLGANRRWVLVSLSPPDIRAQCMSGSRSTPVKTPEAEGALSAEGEAGGKYLVRITTASDLISGQFPCSHPAPFYPFPVQLCFRTFNCDRSSTEARPALAGPRASHLQPDRCHCRTTYNAPTTRETTLPRTNQPLDDDRTLPQARSWRSNPVLAQHCRPSGQLTAHRNPPRRSISTTLALPPFDETSIIDSARRDDSDSNLE